jgi:LysR family transcriptional regulator, mexEF-oprN operon transcriptional activator
MNQIDVLRVDLNLLRVFSVLMREGSVTRAAARLSLGQPAVSHALNRLRDITGDPLFVRDGRRMEPTDRARELIEKIAPALESIETALRTTRQFDPGTAANIFSIGMSDDLQTALLPALMRRLYEEAPEAKLKIRPLSYATAPALLDSGEVSTVVGFLRSLPANAKLKKLRTSHYRVVRAKHGKSALTLDEYCLHNHILVTAAGDFRGVIDTELEKHRKVRRIVTSVPHFGIIADLLPGTELLATVPDHVASLLAKRAGLTVEPLPIKSPTFDIGMAWRAAADRDPAEIWFRNLISLLLSDK